MIIRCKMQFKQFGLIATVYDKLLTLPFKHQNYYPHLAKTDLNKKSGAMHQTLIQAFNIDAQGFRKTKNENPPTRKVGVTS